MKKFIVVLLALVLFVSCTGCLSIMSEVLKDESQTASLVSKSNTDSSKADDTNEEQTEYKVGDTVSIENIELTVVKIQKGYTPSYSQPKSGKEYIKIDVKIENKSDNDISISPFYFSIQDSNGTVQDPDVTTYSLDDQLESAELVPGGSISGSLCFQVSKNDNGLKIIYEPSVWSDKKIVVKL